MGPRSPRVSPKAVGQGSPRRPQVWGSGEGPGNFQGWSQGELEGRGQATLRAPAVLKLSCGHLEILHSWSWGSQAPPAPCWKPSPSIPSRLSPPLPWSQAQRLTDQRLGLLGAGSGPPWISRNCCVT